MATNFLSPLFNEQTFDANGNPLSGGKVYTYLIGSTTPQATYTTENGTTAQANPIILNSRGEPDNPIWLAQNTDYKFALYDSNNVLIRTIDRVSGVNDIQTATVDQWQASGLTPTYISSTSFSVAGDQTSIFQVGRRVKTTNTGGTAYSVILTSVYTTLTTITLSNDSGTLDSGLSAVSYAILSASNVSLPRSKAARDALGLGAGADIASAATLDLTARTGNIVRITGTTATTAVTLNNGDQVWCYAVGAWPLTYHATNMPIKGGASYTCEAGDIVTFTKNGSGTLSVDIFRNNGTVVGIVPKVNGGTGNATGPILRGHIDGLTLSTAGSSATMSIAAGEATDSTAAAMLTLAASISKTTASWAVGTAQGGLDTGAIANSTWYYFFLIRRPDTGVVDVIFSATSASPTLPTNYTQYRYIGAGLTNGSAQWTKFLQTGDEFFWDVAVEDLNSTVTGPTNLTCSIPRGRKMRGYFALNFPSTTGSVVYISDPDRSDQAVASPSVSMAFSSNSIVISPCTIFTNTSAQIRYRCAASTNLIISTQGWMDLRGKNS